MKPELTWLVWAVLLAFLFIVVAALGSMLQLGMARLAGNREGLPEITGWPGRAGRTYLATMLDNLVLFAALVLTAVAADKTNASIAAGRADLRLGAAGAWRVVYRRHPLAAHAGVDSVGGGNGDDPAATGLRAPQRGRLSRTAGRTRNSAAASVAVTSSSRSAA